MRRILSAAEYEKALRDIPSDESLQLSADVARSAWKLMERNGLDRVVFLCDDPLRQIAKQSLERLAQSGKKASMALLSKDQLPELSRTLICDLLFSTCEDDTFSRKRDLWIKAMSGPDRSVLSVAIPAGVDPDTGKAGDPAVQAKMTVALMAYLPGLFFRDGLDRCGEIYPVGGETERMKGIVRFEASDAQRLLPPRKRTAHKGDSGRALLCVGSPLYVGAALLSARSCLAAGAGILYVACPDVVRTALGRLPEAIGISIGPDWDTDSCSIAIRALEGVRAVGLGCGVGHGDVSTLIEAVLRAKLSLVLDADGLNCLSRRTELYPLLHEKVIITPHPGEMSRLTGLAVEEILDDPVGLSVRFAEKWGCIVLLKGAATVISDGKRTCIVAEGNAGLGKGGSGDVLTGIITGLLCQGIEPFSAACLGSYLLGTSADKAFELLKERMLRATNIIEALEDWNE